MGKSAMPTTRNAANRDPPIPRRQFLRAFLDHDERLLFGYRAHVQHDGDGYRSHSVLGRLPFRRKSARHRMAEDPATRPGGHRETAEWQCPSPAQDLRVMVSR